MSYKEGRQLQSGSLTLTSSPDRYQGRRHLTRKDICAILPRHRFVLELHLAGKTAEEIKELSGYSTGTISEILNSEEVIALRQQIMNDYDKEFEANYQLVLKKLKGHINSDNDSTSMDAIKTWLRYSKADLSKKGDVNVNLTAEDIVFNILNQRADEERMITDAKTLREEDTNAREQSDRVTVLDIT